MDSTVSFILEAGMASAYLALKLFLVFAVARFIQPRWALDRFSSLIAGWLMIQALQAGLVLGLSAVGLLYQPYFLTITLIFAALVYWRTRMLSLLRETVNLSWRDHPALIAIGGVLTLMWLRSLFLYDFTWDAQTYGLPRLAIWLNSGSVFVHMPTLQLNLFVNEWNAELNALAFALASGGYLGFAFGNLEVLLWLFVSIAWVARLLGASAYWAIILSAVLGSAPAMIGLASTIKGDLLAITAFVIAVGWLIRAMRDKSALAVVLCLLSATLAVGAKISVALPVIAVLSVAAGMLGTHGIREISRLTVLTKSVLFLSLMVFSSRLWTNWAVYGNPLKRIDVEQAHFSLGNMFANLDLAGIRLFGILDEVQGEGAMWALAGSMGGAAWFIAAASLLALIGAWRNTRASRYISRSKADQNERAIATGWLILVAGAILFGTLVSMTLSPAYLWTFRYFAPGILLLLIGAGVFALRASQTAWQHRAFTALAALAVLVNVGISIRPGEVLPTPNLVTLAGEIKRADTPLRRMALFIKGPYQIAGVEALGLDSTIPLKILAFKDLETSFIPFVGSRAQNTILTVANGNDLLTAAAKPGWDVVAILQKMELRNPNLKSALEQQGYWVLVDNSQYVIALPKQRITLTPVSDLNEVQWTPWNSPDGARMASHDGIPEVESARPIDGGFFTQEFRIKGSILIRASFEGEIAGTGTHAAHLSLHGKQPIITLPAGRYTSTQSYQGILPTLEGEALQRLSFGLGGWAEGSGNIRLMRLEVFQLRVDGGGAVPAPSNIQKRQNSSPLLVFVLGVAMLLGCALFGRRLLSILGVENLSMMGGGLIIGYGVFGLFLLISLKYLSNPTIGALLFSGMLGAMLAHRFYAARKVADEPTRVSPVQIDSRTGLRRGPDNPGSSVLDGLIAVVLFSWVVVIALTYLPLGALATDPQYRFPEIYDLPKHLFAMHSIFNANDWPPPNPFFSGEVFAYNYLFYYPPVFIAKLVGNSLANFQTFTFAVIAIAIALPMVILDIVRSITTSKVVHLGSVLLATWVGGLTPLWISREPRIGFFLYTDKLLTSQIWVDELFQSVIFVPQHVFAVLCGLLSIFILVNDKTITSDNKRLFVAGMLTVAGALSSLILLPHLVVSYVVGAIVVLFLRRPASDQDTSRAAEKSLTMAVFLLPLIFLLPFLFEISKWSGGTGALLSAPELTRQWFYVFAAIGLVVPLAMIGLVQLSCKAGVSYIDSPGKHTLFGISVLAMVGVLGLLFGGYPDAGIKSGLWLRITLIPLAGMGMLILIRKIERRPRKWISSTAIVAIFLGIAALNVPTAIYFSRSAWAPLDPGIKVFVDYVRALPVHSRIALFSSEQVLVALTGRQIDFDFSPIRADSYMPPEGRHRANIFWDEMKQNDPIKNPNLYGRYDYLIAPAGSPADERLAIFFTERRAVGSYAVFETKMQQGEIK
ncbi:MAG: hypothetical protein Q8N48_14125 [Thiobacillus sp.]|nr:hypothetical protein [Thiobacillus sp.]MDP2979952.1 hypothetical protein [Thiobacillus sp.]